MVFENLSDSEIKNCIGFIEDIAKGLTSDADKPNTPHLT
jgi:hypothetical protein